MLIMESLSYCLEHRSPVFLDEFGLAADFLARNKNLVNHLDTRDLYDFHKSMLGLDREMLDSIEFKESVLPHGTQQLLLGDSCLGGSSDEMSDNLNDKVPSTSVINPDQFTRASGLGSVLSAAVEPNNQKESLIDLKKRTDSKKVNGSRSSKESLVLSFVEDSLPAKRARTANLHSQVPLCKVQGCYKDLRSSKDYHKRHRVCDIHSKTAKVIIDGIEQRFCQQCSRFHLLSEFDDGKRSCRKRLAGHNERRRKPHFSSRSLEMALLKSASFLSPERLPGGFYYHEKYLSYEQSRYIKLEQAAAGISQLALPVTNAKSPKKSLGHQNSIRKQHLSKACNDGAVEFELPKLPDSCCALSLLSNKSQNLTSDSAGTSEALPPIVKEHHHSCIGINQKCAYSKNFDRNELLSSGSGIQEGITMVHDGIVADCFQVPRDALQHFPEVGPIVNLLQLSSNLQRVEQQRNSMQVKQENPFCCSSTV